MPSAHPIVALWCIPRSVSTAFERMMAARGDFTVLSEPFSESYYFADDRVSTRYDRDPGVRYNDFNAALETVLAAAQDGPVFFKDMAYHVRRYMDADFLSQFRNIVLMRDPRRSLVSMYKRMPDFTLEEAGFEPLSELVAILDAMGERPFVMDGELLRADPEGVCRQLCAAIDVPFESGALSWEKGEEAHWDRWQSWFTEAADSTQFREPDATLDEETLDQPQVKSAVQQCDPYYQALAARVDHAGIKLS
ncbi:MAG: hypothetical protein ACPG1A_05595 [Halioglobus sp.]